MTNKLQETFEKLKGSVKRLSKNEQDDILTRLAELAENANKTGQETMLNSLRLQYKWSKKEINTLVPNGYDKYINIEDIEDAISMLGKEHIRRLLLTSVDRYLHPIPKENAEKIEKAKEYFDNILILHTDFSGKDRAATDEVRKEKDPVAFGVLVDKSGINNRPVQNPHYYIITDWEDEYCDLTLARLVDEYKQASGKELTVNNALETLNVIFPDAPEE